MNRIRVAQKAACAVALLIATPAVSAAPQTSQSTDEEPQSRRSDPDKILAPAARDSRLDPAVDAAFADFLGICSKCETERDALKAENEKLKAEIAARERARSVVSESFGYITVEWLKAALWNAGGYYDKAEVARLGYQKIVGTGEYNEQTIRAVKAFQCDFYPKAVDDTCNKTISTGWATFPEARAAVCEQGFKATDGSAWVLGYWYATGIVFEQNLPFARALVAAYRKNLQSQAQGETDSQRRAFIVSLELEARRLGDVIDARINDIPRLTVAERDALRSRSLGDYALSEICPRIVGGRP